MELLVGLVALVVIWGSLFLLIYAFGGQGRLMIYGVVFVIVYNLITGRVTIEELIRMIFK